MTTKFELSVLEKLFSQSGVTDICILASGEVFLDRGNGMEKYTETEFDSTSIKQWLIATLSQQGKSWDAKHPFVDLLVEEKFRLHAVFPPVSRSGITLSFRKLGSLSDSITAARKSWSGDPLFKRLGKIIEAHESLLICGGTGSGKTTLLNLLLCDVSHRERMIALEDLPELTPQHPHFLSLESRAPNADGIGAIDLRTLLKQTLRMRPDRIILGECRGAEVLDLLQALNTGHRGTLATIHANSCREALRRLELLCLLATDGKIQTQAVRELVSSAIQWICFVERVGSERKIVELTQVAGLESGTILLRPFLQAHAFHPEEKSMAFHSR